MEPIKTKYKGTEFKSRLEANMAYILDMMEYEWEYEPESFLLENGEHYQPDFFVSQLDLWIETRGYSNVKGDLQIEDFSKKLVEEGEEEFLILKPDACKFLQNDEKINELWLAEAIVSKCKSCRKMFFYPLTGFFGCRNCGQYDGDHHLIGQKELMMGKDSEIYVGMARNYIKLKKWVEESEERDS